MADMNSLANLYQGWDGHQTSLVHAIAPLTHDQLIWRPATGLSSAGELARHISLGRITWFGRMGAPAADAKRWAGEKPTSNGVGKFHRNSECVTIQIGSGRRPRRPSARAAPEGCFARDGAVSVQAEQSPNKHC